MNTPHLARNVGLSLVALLVVLGATWLLVPRSQAPFIYAFF